MPEMLAPKFLEAVADRLYSRSAYACCVARVLRPSDDSLVLWWTWNNDRSLVKRQVGVSWIEVSDNLSKGEILTTGPFRTSFGLIGELWLIQVSMTFLVLHCMRMFPCQR